MGSSLNGVIIDTDPSHLYCISHPLFPSDAHVLQKNRTKMKNSSVDSGMHGKTVEEIREWYAKQPHTSASAAARSIKAAPLFQATKDNAETVSKFASQVKHNKIQADLGDELLRALEVQALALRAAVNMAEIKILGRSGITPLPSGFADTGREGFLRIRDAMSDAQEAILGMITLARDAGVYQKQAKATIASMIAFVEEDVVEDKCVWPETLPECITLLEDSISELNLVT